MSDKSGKDPKQTDLSVSLMDKLKKFGLTKLICVLAAGVLVLMFLSEFMGGTGSGTTTEKKTETSSKENLKNSDSTDEYIVELENRFKQVLMEVEGIGKVKVMITAKSSKESVILKDENSQEETTEEQDSAGGSRKSSSKNRKGETVFSQSQSGVSSPYTVKVLEPQIEGVVIVAEGGDNEVVKSNIISTVEVLFNVPAHKVKVMKLNP